MQISTRNQKRSSLLKAAAAAATTLLLLSSESALAAKPHSRSTVNAHKHLAARQSSNVLDVSNYMEANYKNGSAAPGALPSDSPGQYVSIDDQLGADDNSQVPTCDTIFIGGAAVNGSDDNGWEGLPNVLGFDLLRDLKIEGDAVLPYYEQTGKDATKIKRVVLVQPGKPRDSWKYINLIRNALTCAASREWGVDMSTILVAGAAWLNKNDASAGAAQANDLYFGDWSGAGLSAGPGETTVTSFKAFDQLVEKYFDKSKYPNLNNVVLAGHSLGASFTQRYAMLRNPTSDDPNMIFWMGNPGAYVWPTDTRPVMNNGTCDGQFNDWPYGLNDTDPKNVPIYARKGFNPQQTVATYFSRSVHYNLGLLDDGPGDTHCEAQYEGPTHLARGVNLMHTLQGIPAAANHTFNFVANTSHQDYKMFSADTSLQRLFVTDINTRIATSSSKSSSSISNQSSSSSSSSSNSKSAGVSLFGTSSGAVVGLAALLAVGSALL